MLNKKQMMQVEKMIKGKDISFILIIICAKNFSCWFLCHSGLRGEFLLEINWIMVVLSGCGS